MTLKIVADNTVELQVYNFQDIAACARRFADQLEAGEQGEPTRVVLVVETDEGLGLSIWGEIATGFELVGILDAAKMRAHESIGEDD
jgi:hypothetical protein